MRKYGINFDFGLASFLSDVFQPISSLELGCGVGAYSHHMARAGASPAWGIEPERMASPLLETGGWPRQLAVDMFSGRAQEGSCAAALGRFDLVYSIEVAEHIPRHLHGRVADFLATKTAGFLVFSAAIPGQPGVGHIACRSRDEWRAEFEQRGLVPLDRLAAALRQSCQDITHARNILVFAASNSSSIAARSEALTVAAENKTANRRRSRAARRQARPYRGVKDMKGFVEVRGRVVPWWSPIKQGEIDLFPELVLKHSACWTKRRPHGRSAQKTSHANGVTERDAAGRLCVPGIRSLSVCCAEVCGRCGGPGCSGRPGGRRLCCEPPIERSGRECSAMASDMSCFIARQRRRNVTWASGSASTM